MDFALLFDGSNWHWGWGARQAFEKPTKNTFYINDFTLSQKKAWIQFEKQGICQNVEEIPPQVRKLKCSREWQLATKVEFQKLWKLSQEYFATNKIEKIVLALSDRSQDFYDHVLKNDELIQFSSRNANFFYSYSIEEKAAWGLSPELLFEISSREQLLKSIALAGTRLTFNADKGLLPCTDSLQIEHKKVVDFYVGIAQQSSLDIRILPQQLHQFQTIQHLKTPIEINLKNGHLESDFWIQAIHPTPALGVFPRNTETLKNLDFIRKDLPPSYASPFGVEREEGAFFIATIRGYYLQNTTDLYRTLGVGVTPASTLDSEWNEIQAKRNAVASFSKAD